MSWLREVAESYDNPADFVWGLMAIICTGFLVFYTIPNPSLFGFHLLMLIFIIARMIVIPLTFHPIIEDVADWEEETDLPKVGTYALASIALIALISFVFGFITGEVDPTTKLPLKSAIWVPTMLYPLSTETLATTGGFFAFVMDIFATIFSVVPGEESLRELFHPFIRIYENTPLSNLPFAVQPAVLFGTAIWASWHIIKGQHPLMFFWTVLFAGIALDHFSAKSGTRLTNRGGHSGWNFGVIFGKFLRGGYLKIVVG